jgi:tRNA G18 (ribose-2'-O)-methylase SpoU
VCFDRPMQTLRIDDFDDPLIAEYRNLKDSQLIADHHHFIVEGRGNLLVLLEESRFAPDSILLSERTYASLREELEALAPSCPVYVAGQKVMDQIVGFPIHRGCLAAVERGGVRDPMELAREALERESAPRIVVLEGLTNHDNVGGIFRNAMCLGGRAVLLCPRCCDPLYRKAIRTSMGGSLVVPYARATNLTQMLDGLKALGFEILALDPAEEGVDLSRIDARATGPVALLFGTEGKGLSDEALGRADRRVRVAMEPGTDSLNVSVTAAIALHALRIQDGGSVDGSSKQD